MENSQTPMLDYLRKVLAEHTVPLEGMAASMITAGWLLVILNKAEATYKKHGTI